MSHPYQYVVLRCVPRVDRGEFLNVGVVLYCQSAGFLAAACHVDEERLRGLRARARPRRPSTAALAVVDDVCAAPTGGGPPRPRDAGQAVRLAQRAAQHGAPAPACTAARRRPGGRAAALLDRLVR